MDGAVSWAISDPEIGTILVGDRLGVCPLYYSISKESVTVAGTPEACLGPFQSVEPCEEALVAFLASEPPPEDLTYFRGVRAVSAGEQVVIRTGGVTRSKYWSLDSVPALVLQSDDEYCDALTRLLGIVLADARRLVPGRVAVALSAGLDSGLVAAFARASGPVVPIRWGASRFPEADEAAESGEVARLLQLDPGFVLDLSDYLPFTGGQEITDRSAPLWSTFAEAWLATFDLAAGAGMRAVLTGEYGDMLWGGAISSYPDLLRAGDYRELLRDVAASARNTGLGLTKIIREDILAYLLPRFLRRSVRQRHFGDWLPWLTARGRVALGSEPGGSWPGLSSGRRGRIEYLSNPLIPWAIGQINRLAWSRGVRLLHPLLDWRLAEFMSAVPQSLCFRNGVDRWIQRRIASGLLPQQVALRQSKPLLTGVVRNALYDRAAPRVGALMRGMRLSDMGLVHERILRSANEGMRESGAWDRSIWQALQLETWLRQRFA